jgi:hypothetical protein
MIFCKPRITGIIDAVTVQRNEILLALLRRHKPNLLWRSSKTLIHQSKSHLQIITIGYLLIIISCYEHDRNWMNVEMNGLEIITIVENSEMVLCKISEIVIKKSGICTTRWKKLKLKEFRKTVKGLKKFVDKQSRKFNQGW